MKAEEIQAQKIQEYKNNLLKGVKVNTADKKFVDKHDRIFETKGKPIFTKIPSQQHNHTSFENEFNHQQQKSEIP